MISLNQVTKEFHGKIAVNELTFEVDRAQNENQDGKALEAE